MHLLPFISLDNKEFTVHMLLSWFEWSDCEEIDGQEWFVGFQFLSQAVGIGLVQVTASSNIM
jgi:hypothetical protein